MRLEPPRLPVAGLHLAVLWSFAVAEPVFDLLGRNPEFFAARGSSRWDVVAFALMLVLVPPALLLAIEAVTPRRARGVLHALFVAGLVGLLVLLAIRRESSAGWLLVAIAGTAGLAAAAIYARFAAARLLLTLLAPAPLLFASLFLFASDVSQLTFSETATAKAATVPARGPAVIVVFDELPLNSLLDAGGRIDPVRFPNFARLARGATWFARDSSVSGRTDACSATRSREAGASPTSTRSTVPGLSSR